MVMCLDTVTVNTCPFFFQLPVSVYESVIDIINGEVLLILNIIYIFFPA